MSVKGKTDFKTPRKIFSKTGSLLIIYDLVILAAIEVVLLSLYSAGQKLGLTNILMQYVFVAVITIIFRLLAKVYGQVWRYGGIQSFIRLIMSDAAGFFVYYFVESALPIEHISFPRKLSICCLWLLGSMIIRMMYRYAYKCCDTSTVMGKIFNKIVVFTSFGSVHLNERAKSKKVKVAIVGAGVVGVSLAQELLANENAMYEPRLFVDKNKEKVGKEIYGIKVFSHESVSESLFNNYEIQEVIITIPDLTLDEKKKFYDFYSGLGCKVKSYDFPDIQQSGKRLIREFSPEELLFRRPTYVKDQETIDYYKDKVVLVTGGGGSIGSEMCRQIAAMQPKQLIILDVYENGAYEVQQELRSKYHDELNMNLEIISVCNIKALDKVFSTYNPDIIIHAAAHKHVPLMEHNAVEAVENNVFGTLNCVRMAEKYNCERFIMVSTDKAVNPTNVMGATKRMCEMIVMAYSKISKHCKYSATRFGNVLGSAGSVIPLFKKQIANGGPVTVTDKRIIRYFMTIPEASQLVLKAGMMAKNGELFVLDMGNPVRIIDLAESIIKLSGFVPYQDIDIVETGLRPGEKLYEELLMKTEGLKQTSNSLIFIEEDTPISEDELNAKLDKLSVAADSQNADELRKVLHEVVPTYKTPEEVNAKAIESTEMQLATAPSK